MKETKCSKLREWLGKLSVYIYILSNQHFSTYTILNGLQKYLEHHGYNKRIKIKQKLKSLEKIKSEIRLVQKT